MVSGAFWIQKHHFNNGRLHGLENSTCQSTRFERFPTHRHMRIRCCFHHNYSYFLQFYFRICHFYLYCQISVYSYFDYSVTSTFVFA
ncbi:unnamed protein product [Callosobruchus maculatus]|uniref:Uncharacterized protein n=1 Tax=Callosobruchus maculatus TaxID=64391 RepID=A0A653BIY0_CALMS|nr:unnamed protein product [Callosobruchus maculatus]